jgi:hypothetical protein
VGKFRVLPANQRSCGINSALLGAWIPALRPSLCRPLCRSGFRTHLTPTKWVTKCLEKGDSSGRLAVGGDDQWPMASDQTPACSATERGIHSAGTSAPQKGVVKFRVLLANQRTCGINSALLGAWIPALCRPLCRPLCPSGFRTHLIPTKSSDKVGGKVSGKGRRKWEVGGTRMSKLAGQASRLRSGAGVSPACSGVSPVQVFAGETPAATAGTAAPLWNSPQTQNAQ